MPELVQYAAALVAIAGATAFMTYRVLRRRRCNGCNRCERAVPGGEGGRPGCSGKGVRAPGLRVYPGGP